MTSGMDTSNRDTSMDGRILDRLFEVVASRKGADPASSWTAKLLAEAPELPARKMAEEATETLIAALGDDRQALTAEAADLIYHLMVVLVSRGVELEDVWAELQRREEQSGIAEKAGRGQ